jgi:hypothetical protein
MPKLIPALANGNHRPPTRLSNKNAREVGLVDPTSSVFPAITANYYGAKNLAQTMVYYSPPWVSVAS